MKSRTPLDRPRGSSRLHCSGLQGRRILLLFAIGLLATAAAAALVPVPEAAREGDESAQPEADAAGSTGDDVVEIGFSADAPARPSAGPKRANSAPPREPPTETAGSDERVIVTVTARRPGEVFLDGLGRVESVAPRTPAVFDLFTDSTGEFDVRYAPVEGGERTIGTLVVGAGDPSAAADPSAAGDPSAGGDRPTAPTQPGD